MIDWIIYAVVVLVVGMFALINILNQVDRAKAKRKGHNRCELCRCHLKRAKTPDRAAGARGYVFGCHHCGHVQSWATATPLRKKIKAA
jgi:uncharacterized protein CbrC (UPF0167 family)